MRSEANVSPTVAVRTVIDGLSSFQLFSLFVPSFFQSTRRVSDHLYFPAARKTGQLQSWH